MGHINHFCVENIYEKNLKPSHANGDTHLTKQKFKSESK